MRRSASGKETERKAFASNTQGKDRSNSPCSFCAFVLTIYPSLKGMTPRDEATFREHLRASHGLKNEIFP